MRPKRRQAEGTRRRRGALPSRESRRREEKALGPPFVGHRVPHRWKGVPPTLPAVRPGEKAPDPGRGRRHPAPSVRHLSGPAAISPEIEGRHGFLRGRRTGRTPFANTDRNGWRRARRYPLVCGWSAETALSMRRMAMRCIAMASSAAREAERTGRVRDICISSPFDRPPSKPRTPRGRPPETLETLPCWRAPRAYSDAVGPVPGTGFGSDFSRAGAPSSAIRLSPRRSRDENS